MLLDGCISLLIKCWMIRLIPQSQPHYTVFMKKEVTYCQGFFAWHECGEDFLVKFVGKKHVLKIFLQWFSFIKN